MDFEKRVELVKQNTSEIVTEEELRKLLQEKRNLSAYYGTAPTGPFHMAYLIPLSKVFDLSNAGITTKILIANVHAALDDLKTPWEEIDKRAEYYKKCIELSFPWEAKPEFVIGKTFQLKNDYMLDVLKLATLVTVSRATRAASEVTRMKNPKVSELIYPLMQSLDEQYLDVDIQIGGVDQRHIMMLAREYLAKIGYGPRVEVMTPLIVSLQGPGAKMSASLPMSHIKVYDSEEQIKEKISKAYCLAGEVKDNPVLQLFQYLVFPIKGSVKIERPAKFGGSIEFKSYPEMENLFVEKKLHPADMKNALISNLTGIFKRARDYFEKNRDMLKDLGEPFLN